MEAEKQTTKIILMRHARSEWNEALEQLYSKEAKGALTKDERHDKHKDLTKTTLPPIINSELHEIGIKQCLEAQSEVDIKFPNVKRIILSPLRRVIQTFELSFENHHNFNNLKISFVQELREQCNSACDIACITEEEKACIKYPS